MKAISLWQPWASAIAMGSKRIETRSWGTTYRGPLAIHAAKRVVKYELLYYGCCWNWCGALGRRMGSDPNLWAVLPFGAIVAICRLADCRPAGSFTVEELDTVRYPAMKDASLLGWTERQMGDFSPGRFGWVLADIRPLAIPIPYLGQQGLFDICAVCYPSAAERGAV
jgi:hypothetical protein